jgi:hypothetical protein
LTSKPPNVSHNFPTFGGLQAGKTRHTLNSLMSHGLTLENSLQRRSAVRYKLRLPVIFYWDDDGEHTGAGFTIDVALDGALISSSKCPPIGVSVRIEVLIPSPDQNDEELRIECIGKVTRVVEHFGCRLFGVHGSFDDDHLTRRAFE